MEDKNQYGFAVIVIMSLSIVSFMSCIAAEFKRTKKKDLKLDGKLCYLPGSHAFGLGLTALTCLLAAQIMGYLVICWKFCWRRRNFANMFLLVISWMSFGIAVILISAATSMNTRQPYGKGWLDGKCYVVGDGVYIGSAVLILVDVASMIGSVVVTVKTSRVQKGDKP